MSKDFVVNGVSHCSFEEKNEIKLTLYQHNFWSFIGYTEESIVTKGKCTNLEGWWDNRASMIKVGSKACFRVWDGNNCTGFSNCICPSVTKVELKDEENDWNNKISSLSMCDYEA